MSESNSTYKEEALQTKEAGIFLNVVNTEGTAAHFIQWGTRSWVYRNIFEW